MKPLNKLLIPKAIICIEPGIKVLDQQTKHILRSKTVLTTNALKQQM